MLGVLLFFFFFFGGFVGPIRKRIFIFEESSKSVEQFSENTLEISIEKLIELNYWNDCLIVFSDRKFK